MESINNGAEQYETKNRVKGIVLETLREVSELKVDRKQVENNIENNIENNKKIQRRDKIDKDRYEISE